MVRSVRRRFWTESILGANTFVLLVMTLISREWIEEIFGVDPDGGSGALEWAIVVVLAIATAAAWFAAGREWRRAAVAAA